MDKRFKLHIKWSNLTKTEGIAELSDNGQPLLKTECIEDARLLQTILNELNEENKELKKENMYLRAKHTQMIIIMKDVVKDLKRIDTYRYAEHLEKIAKLHFLSEKELEDE